MRALALPFTKAHANLAHGKVRFKLLLNAPQVGGWKVAYERTMCSVGTYRSLHAPTVSETAPASSVNAKYRRVSSFGHSDYILLFFVI